MRADKASLALTATAVAAIGFALKSACADTGWGGGVETYYQLCYSDVGPLYYVRGFADGITPYLESFEGRYLEYPVLIGFWMWLTALVTGALGASASTFVYLTWVGSLVFAVAATLVMHSMKTESSRAWWFALSPALLLTLGINWDALALLAAVVALWAWQRQRIGWAGVAIGLGTAAKLFPALLIVPMLFALLQRRDFRAAATLCATTAAAWLAVNAPVFLASPEGWWEFYRFSRERGIDFGSLWLALSYGLDISISTESANAIGLLVVALAVLILWFVRQRVDVFTAAFVLVALFALFNKVYSPQFWLWLTPLAALAAVRLREFAVWQFAQLIYFVGIWRYLLFLSDASAAGSLTPTAYSWTIAVHWIATLTLVVIALVRSWRSSTPELSESGKVQP